MSRLFVSFAIVLIAIVLFRSQPISRSPAPAKQQTANSNQESNEQVDFDKKLKEMGFDLPEPSGAVGIYKSVVVVDNMAYLAGHIPRTTAGEIMRGKVGDGATLEQAQAAAKRSAVAMLASLKAELGTLNRVKRLVKTTGMVNCTPDFVDQPKVINGCSELLRDLFGQENGVGARAAVGMNSLPAGAIVEIEAIFELTDQ